jgi:hypothetical protein
VELGRFSTHHSARLDVVDGVGQTLRIIRKLAQATVAIEAENTSNFTGIMVMVDLIRIVSTANRTHIRLLLDQLVNVSSADSVSSLEVVVARSAVQTLARFRATSVVTGLAVGVAAILRVAVPRELLEGLPLTAVGASLHAAHIICEV